MVCLLSGEETPYIMRHKADHIVIDSDSMVPWTLDGEAGGAHSHVEIKTLKRQTKIIVPGKTMEAPEKRDRITTEEDIDDEYN